MTYEEITLKESYKMLNKDIIKNQSEFVIKTIKHFAKITSLDTIAETNLAFSVKLLITSVKQLLDELEKDGSNPKDIAFMLYKYANLETVNTLGNDIIALYEQNKAASVDEICKGIEDIAAKMQDEEYLDDKITKFIEGIKVDKG